MRRKNHKTKIVNNCSIVNVIYIYIYIMCVCICVWADALLLLFPMKSQYLQGSKLDRIKFTGVQVGPL